MAGRPPKTTTGPSRKDTILAQAEILFSQHGFEGASVRDIAAAASVSTNTIFHHFGNKAGLYRAVIDDNFQAIINAFLGSTVADDRVELVVDRLVETLTQRLMVDHPHLRGIMLHEISRGFPVLKEVVAPQLPTLMEHWQKILNPNGNLPADKVFLTFISIISAIIYPLLILPVFTGLSPGMGPDALTVERLKTHIRTFILEGVQT